MSTKIFNGHRLSGATRVPAMGRRLRTTMEPVYRDAAIAAVAAMCTITASIEESGAEDALAEAVQIVGGRNAVTELAAIRSGGSLVQDDAPLQRTGLVGRAVVALEALQRAVRRPYATRLLAPAADLTFEVAFLDDPEDPGWIYALPYYENPAYDAVWSAVGADPWPYWDNSDGPDDVSPAEWQHRRAVWCRVLPQFTSPAEAGCVTWRWTDDDLVFAAVEGRWLSAGAVAEKIRNDIKVDSEHAATLRSVLERIEADSGGA